MDPGERLRRELLVKTVAEGVEIAVEAEACIRLGFTHAQGYYFAHPAPVDTFSATAPGTFAGPLCS